MIAREQIFIGSKNRLLFPMQKLLSGATLFAEPQDYEDYSLLHGKAFRIVKLKKDDGGFGFLLNSMLSYAKNKKYSHYCFCDDDITGFSTRNTKFIGIMNLLQEMEKISIRNKYSQLSLSFKGHNWFFKEGDIKENVGTWCFILNNTDDIMSVGGYDETLPIYNDWDMAANLIKCKLKTACYYGSMFDHKMKSMEGGASEIYKKQELLDKAAGILKKKYGEECIREVSAHGQKEIRFIWGKLK
jgi:hypothetical protein